MPRVLSSSGVGPVSFFGTFLGIAAAWFGGRGVLTAMIDLRRRQRMKAAPTVRISEASGGGIVEIKGRIVASEAGLVGSTVGGRQAVWFQTTVEDVREVITGSSTDVGGTSKSTQVVTIWQKTESREFLVDDGSGQLARVKPDHAYVVTKDVQITRDDGDPLHLGGNRYVERVLVPGEEIYALGPSVREQGPPVTLGYREATSTQLVMCASDMSKAMAWMPSFAVFRKRMSRGGVGELILSNKSERELTDGIRHDFRVSTIVFVVGVAMLIGSQVFGG